MVDTLKNLMNTGIKALEEPTVDYKKWVVSHIGQVVSTVSQINWTNYTENYIRDSALEEWYEQNKDQILKVYFCDIS